MSEVSEVQWRRLRRVLIINELMAAILRGDLEIGLYTSDAPADLCVVGADWHDPQTIVIFVESQTFEPVKPGEIIPIFPLCFSKKETAEHER